MKEEIEKLNSLLTIVIPVKNEEVNLPECLKNLQGLQNVIIVDSDSKDKTVEIAKSYNREVIQFIWNGRFPKKRNWILRNYSFATPWVMFLDADERITEKWIQEVACVLDKNLNSSVDAFVCYYDNWFMGRVLHYGDVMRKTAILRVGKGEYEWIDENKWSTLDMEIHEHLVVNGDICEIKSRLEHYDKRSFESHWQKHQQYADWECNRYNALVKECGGVEKSPKLTKRQKIKYRHITKWYFPSLYFCVSYIIKRGILDGMAGFKFALFKARYFYLIRAKIIERKR